VSDIQRGVSNLSVDNMEQVLEKAILQKTECQKVCKRLAEERMVLSEYSKDIGKVGDKQFIVLVSLVCGDSQGERIRKGCFLLLCFLVFICHVLSIM